MDHGEINEEFELNEVRDNIVSSVGSRLSLFSKEFGFGRYKWETSSALKLPKDCYRGFVIHPNGRLYRVWVNMIFLWSIYSTFFTPLEFGFFRGLPLHLTDLESVQIVFLADVVLQFFVAYLDPHTYKMVHDRNSIALRYAKGSFLLDFLGCFPWDFIYKVTGRREVIRCMIWIRLYRARNITHFFKRMEKDIRINYLFTRIVKLITVELYCTHTAACIFYYLATTIPPAEEGYTWIGSLTMGDYKYINFREIDFWTRYITSLYFAIVTMATVGYGDIHAVNTREMIFIMIYISFDMILGAYLIGNMTALIVKGSKTERFRDKMTDLIKYMNRNNLGKDIRSQVKNHLRLQYESTYTKSRILEDIPVAIRSKISQNLYIETVQGVPLFKGCSDEFLNQIVMKLNEEFFLPGEVIIEQGSAVDQIYIVSHGELEEVVIGEDGTEESIADLVPYDVFGEVAVLCNIPQPYTVRVSELCKLLRMEKQSLTSILQLYFKDSRQILSNLLKGKETDLRIKQLESDITYLIAKQEAELALSVNSAAYHGDLYHLKGLINAGADPSKTDYDGRTALHMAASKGYEDIVRFLAQRGANINSIDKFGNSPLLEAVKGGHDRVAALLVENGAILDIQDAGSYLCKIVIGSKIEVLRRLLENGVDPNSKNYDQRTPLHVAAAEGLHLLAKILIEFGADVLSMDRWGNTPIDEGQKCGSKPLMKILEAARATHL
ncbi:potassium channel KOR2-like [Dioscorea cayenensis subsp. rotundata]|uniref:Potassium channel n=1 Tax=Dioscorea cayennensis subsp. rotundata TaxID=55577 RepID=A0AB40BB58_DIOCR|nr:potassium channel KOR2-like [Dioscorea cayenensis subsp. rotundata]